MMVQYSTERRHRLNGDEVDPVLVKKKGGN